MPVSASTARSVEARRARETLRWAQGAATSVIASELGVSGSLVSQDVRRLRAAGQLLEPRKGAGWWTTDQDAQLATMVAAGSDAGSVAAALGRTVAAVDSRARHLGTRIPADRRGSRAWPAERDRRLTERYQQGAPLRELASELECTLSVLARRLDDLRGAGTPLPYRAPRWSDEELQRLITGYAAGATRQQLGEALGRTPEAIRSQIRRLRRAGHDLYR